MRARLEPRPGYINRVAMEKLREKITKLPRPMLWCLPVFAGDVSRERALRGPTPSKKYKRRVFEAEQRFLFIAWVATFLVCIAHAQQLAERLHARRSVVRGDLVPVGIPTRA